MNDSDNEDHLFNVEVCSDIESGFKTPVNLPNKPSPTFEIASNKKLKLYNTYISTKNSVTSSNVLAVDDEVSINKNHLISSQPELDSDEGIVKSYII